jgi:hypothetical protein
VAKAGKNGTPVGARLHEWATYVASQLWAGQSSRQVIRELEARGLAYEAAVSLVETVEEEMRRGGSV